MVVELNSWSGMVPVRSAVLGLLLSGLSLQAVLAGTPVPYGEDYVRRGQSWADAQPVALNTPAPALAPVDSSLYERQVEQLEQAGGPYADALSEPLAGLGRHYLENGELRQAQSLYRRALHIVRVNDGLYSQRQVPILRELLDSYRVAGEMEALDDRYQYYFRLYGNGQPPYTELRLRAAVEYLRWQREALRLGLGDEKRRLLELYQLNEDLLERVALESGVDSAWRRELTLSQLRNLYLIQDRISPAAEKVGTVTVNPFVGGMPQEADLNDRRLENIERSSLVRGSGLLNDLIAASGQAPAAQRAQLVLELADWYRWNGDLYRSDEYYDQVVGILQEAGETRLLQLWLGQPTELPDNGAFWQPPTGQEGERKVVVTARYDVSARGRATNIQTSTAEEADSGKASRLRRYLAKTKFRPRFVAGEGEAVARLEREYVLLDR